MSEIDELQKRVVEFRDVRDWKQFHNPKDLSISLLLEASELLEHFQWKSAKEMREHITKNKQDVSHEVADVLYWILLIAHDLDIDIEKAFDDKMKINEKKYDVQKAQGTHKKYTEL